MDEERIDYRDYWIVVGPSASMAGAWDVTIDPMDVGKQKSIQIFGVAKPTKDEAVDHAVKVIDEALDQL